MKTATKKIDMDSGINQRIKGDFVAREVKACFSYEMDAILKTSANISKTELPTYDDIVNMYEYPCPQCGTGYQDEDEARGCCKENDSDREIESAPQEIYEWWLVTEWLFNKLKEKGHPVLEFGNNYYWGRCTTGQAILLDGVISEICREMEILEGQANDWSRNYSK